MDVPLSWDLDPNLSLQRSWSTAVVNIDVCNKIATTLEVSGTAMGLAWQMCLLNDREPEEMAG